MTTSANLPGKPPAFARLHPKLQESLYAMRWTKLRPIQIDAILANGEMTTDELREVVVFLVHYVGWPRGSSLNRIVEERIAAHSAAVKGGKGGKGDFLGPGGTKP